MDKQNEVNGTASEPIARYDELPILRTYKVAFDNIVEIGGFWAVGQDKNLYRIEMPGKVKDCMWKNAKRYDIQTGKVVGYTNSDLIRSKTDEDLAVWIYCTCCAAVDQHRLTDYEPSMELCPSAPERWLDWLKQGVSDDGDD